MRRSSGSEAVQSRRPAPQAGPEQAAWWKSRLLAYKQSVLFLWNSLTFSPSFLPGAAIWLILHTLLLVVFYLTGSVLERCGNLLVIASIVYALMHLGFRYGNVTLFQAWNENCEHRFREVCGLLSLGYAVLAQGMWSIAQSRVTNPKKFYGVGLLSSFILWHVGEFLSTAVLLHVAMSCVLLLPLLMERYKSRPEQLQAKADRIAAEISQLFKTILLKIQEAFAKKRTKSQ